MIKRTYSRQISNKIEAFEPGRPFSWRDIEVPGASMSAVQRVLSRLEARSKIKRGGRGIYYIPAQTIVGPRRLPDEALLEKLLLEKRARDKGVFGDERRLINRAIPIGSALFYEIGLTTQVPVRKAFIAPVRLPEESKSLKVSQVPMERYQDLSDNELKAWLALVDLDKVTNESRTEIARSFARYIRSVEVPRKRLRSISTKIGGQKGRKALKNLEYVESIVWPKP